MVILVSKTKRLAMLNEYVSSKGGDTPYTHIDLFQANLYEVRKTASYDRFEQLKKERPKAAALIETIFTDNAAEVAHYFPPDISELRCAQMLAALNPGLDNDASRAKSALDSHIDDL